MQEPEKNPCTVVGISIDTPPQAEAKWLVQVTTNKKDRGYLQANVKVISVTPKSKWQIKKVSHNKVMMEALSCSPFDFRSVFTSGA